MKLHSNTLTSANVREALEAAKIQGKVAWHVSFVVLDKEGSRSHDHGFLIKLGTDEPLREDGKKRRFRDTGTRGAATDEFAEYAATYDEWGWFIAELYKLDNDAVFGSYKSVTDFNAKTGSRYV